jgi:myo-inositol-1(or 4)-monophosphatase
LQNNKVRHQKENQIIHDISVRAFGVVEKYFGRFLTISEKGNKKDVVSGLDIKLDNLILAILRKNFPEDKIASEESSPELAKMLAAAPRIWVIDPLCGSGNAARGIPLFVTNIVLIETGKVEAAWVIDYSRKRVVWGIGGKKIYTDTVQLRHLSKAPRLALIDIDWGYLFKMKDPEHNPIVRRYANVVRDIVISDDFEIHAYNSSLPFLYVATGQLQAALAPSVYPWDVLAACFLIEQNGGVVTNFDGSPWNSRSTSLIMAANPTIHKKICQLIHKHGLRHLA